MKIEEICLEDEELRNSYVSMFEEKLVRIMNFFLNFLK